jgi:hypothetical protein
MAEWLKAHAWKACVRETVPWVRIPLSPPFHIEIQNEFCFPSRLPERAFGFEISGDLFRDPVECRVQIALCFCICPLRTNEILRTYPLVQVDYVRVVDLDIGASKSDIRAIRTSSFRSAPAELKPATAGWCRNGDGKR